MSNQSLRRQVLAVACSLSFLFTSACGSGDNNTSTGLIDGTDGGSTPPAASIGSRAVPGYLISVDEVSAIVAGQGFTFQATITGDAGAAAVTTVEAAIEINEPDVWVSGTPVPGRADTWRWTTALPADLTDQRAWLRITDADGNMCQSGFSDFDLMP